VGVRFGSGLCWRPHSIIGERLDPMRRHGKHRSVRSDPQRAWRWDGLCWEPVKKQVTNSPISSSTTPSHFPFGLSWYRQDLSARQWANLFLLRGTACTSQAGGYVSRSHVDVFFEGDEDVFCLADDGAADPDALLVLLDVVDEPASDEEERGAATTEKEQRRRRGPTSN